MEITSKTSEKLRVLCPVTVGEKTFWRPCGAGFRNRDDSINVYLDLLPVNGKLQIRIWDDPPWKQNELGGFGAGGGQRALPAPSTRPLLPEPQHADRGGDDTPF